MAENPSSGKTGFIGRLRRWWAALRAPGKFLCDTCRYDYRSACSRPERPNATRCDAYKPR